MDTSGTLTTELGGRGSLLTLLAQCTATMMEGLYLWAQTGRCLSTKGWET